MGYSNQLDDIMDDLRRLFSDMDDEIDDLKAAKMNLEDEIEKLKDELADALAGKS